MRHILSIVLAAPLLLAASGAPSRIEKLARLAALEDRRTVGGGELASSLRDPDRGVRWRACLAAARIGDASAMRPLLGLLDDPEPEVRQVAAFALGLIGDAGAGPRLRTALKDRDAVVRARVAEALGRLGDRAAAADIAEMVLAALPQTSSVLTIRGDDPGNAKDPWLELRLGLLALARLKDVPAAESVLLAGGGPRFDWWAAAYAAGALSSPALRSVLVSSASSGDPLARSYAATGLGALDDPGSFDVLAGLVRDRDEVVSCAALRALGRSRDGRATGLAVTALGSTSLAVKLAALEALSTLPPSRGLTPQLVTLVGHEHPSIRGAALRVIARADREELALLLSGMGNEAGWSAKAAIAAALGTVKDDLARGVLSTLSTDDDPRVRAAAATALGASGGTGAPAALNRLLEDPDPAVAASAAAALARGGARSPALQKAAARTRADADPMDRLALAEALAGGPGDDTRAALREMQRDDPSFLVRAAAAARLRGLGEDVRASPPERVRPPADYHVAMAPYDPQPDVPLFTPRVFLRTRQGSVEIHLNIIEAPLAVDAFLDLARRGFYNGLPVERLLAGERLEAGGARGDGRPGVGFGLRTEPGLRPFGRGTVGLVPVGTGAVSSRFFILLRPDPTLDGQTTVLGTVANGMEVVDRLRPEDEIDRVDVWDGR